MNDTACFIESRALSLAYEATRFPSTAPVVLAWLGRARAWAEQHGMSQLAEMLLTAASRIEEPERPCPHCGREMEESIIGATCYGGGHVEIDGWYCERCDYSEREDGSVYP